jgi:hypothetical protein
LEFKMSKVEVVIDPLQDFKNVPEARIEETCGLLPFWFHDWLAAGDERLPLADFIGQVYAHGGGWNPFNEFEIDEDGTMHFPGDPPMIPLMHMSHGNLSVFIYEYAMVTVRYPDGTTSTARMD